MNNLQKTIIFAIISVANFSPIEHKYYKGRISNDVLSSCEVDPCNLPEVCEVGTITSNPKDCSTFYMCNAAMEWELMDCGDLMFDIVTCACNFPDVTECQEPCSTTSTTKQTTMLETTTATSTTTPSTTTAPTTTTAAPPTTTPTAPPTTTTAPPTTVKTTSKLPVTTAVDPMTSTTTRRVTTDAVATYCELDPCNLPEECVADSLIANPQNCSTYYICIPGSTWEMMDCKGLYFDIVTCTCNYEEMATCHEPCTTTTVSQRTTEKITSTAAQTTSEKPTSAVAKTTTEKLTSTAAQTTSEKPTSAVTKTTTEKLTSAVSQTTTQKPTTEAQTVTEKPTSSVSQTTTAKQTTTIIGEKSECELDPCNLPPVCFRGSIVPDPTSCSYYLECDASFNWLRRPCPDGTYFSMIECTCSMIPVGCHPGC